MNSIYLYIVIIAIACIILINIILFTIAFLVHNKLFNHRFIQDSLVKNYTKEEFSLLSKPYSFQYKKETIRGYIYFYDFTNYKGIIVYLHGMWSNHEAYMQDIAFYAKNNYLVLAIDYLGTSISDGKNIKGLGNSLLCADKLLDKIKEDSQLNKYKLYVIGHSWGGFASSNIVKQHKEIDKFVALAPFTSVKSLLKGFLPKSKRILIPYFYLIDILICGKYSMANSFRTLKNEKIKGLIIHSKDDTMVSYLYNTLPLSIKINNKNIEILTLEGKNHQPHYTSEAVTLFIDYINQTRLLKDDAAKLEKYKLNVDFHKLGELDNDIMNYILNFIEK